MPFMANVQEPTTAGGSGSSSESSRPFAPVRATDAGRALVDPMPGCEGGIIDTGRAAGEARWSQSMSKSATLTAGLGCEGGGGVAREGGADMSGVEAFEDERRRPDAARARAAGLRPTGGGGASSSSSSSAAGLEGVTRLGGGAVRVGGGAKRDETLLPPGPGGGGGGGGGVELAETDLEVVPLGLRGRGGAGGSGESLRRGGGGTPRPGRDGGVRAGREGGPVGRGGGGGARCKLVQPSKRGTHGRVRVRRRRRRD